MHMERSQKPWPLQSPGHVLPGKRVRLGDAEKEKQRGCHRRV